MSRTLQQIYIDNPSTIIAGTDLLYLVHSPYSSGTDSAITGANLIAQISPLTTKGDLYTFSTVNDRLPIGSDGQVLQANSATGTGLEWVAPPSASITLLGDSGAAGGSTLTVRANVAATACGATVQFVNGGSTSTLTVTDSNQNTFIGNVCGPTSLVGRINNVGLGMGTLRVLGSAGLRNVALGNFSLNHGTSITDNIAVGTTSFTNLITGDFNIGVGSSSGISYTGNESSNILLNSAGTVGESHALHIGAATGSGNQQLLTAYIHGINGNTLGGTPLVVTIDSTTSQLGVATFPTGAVNSIIAGYGIDVSSPTGNVTVSRTSSTTKVTTTPHVILVTDEILLVDTVTLAAPSTVELPNFVGTDGQTFTIKDFSGDAANNPITIDGNGWNIDLGTTVVLNKPYQSISICWDQSETKYSVLSEYGSEQAGGKTTLVTTTPYTATAEDYVLLVDSATIAGPSTISLVNLPLVDGQTWVIKDFGNSAATNNITIDGDGHTIDGASTFVMNKNRQAITVCWDKSQTQYSIIADYTIASGGLVSPANNVYVAKNGNDANSGGFGDPFLTVNAAIASITTASSSAPFNVIVAPGTYTEASVVFKSYVNLIGGGKGATYFDFTSTTFDTNFLSSPLALITLSDFTFVNGTTTFDFSAGINGQNCIVTLSNIDIPNDFIILNTNDDYAPRIILKDIWVRGNYTVSGFALSSAFVGYYAHVQLTPVSASGLCTFKSAVVNDLSLSGLALGYLDDCPAYIGASLLLTGTGCALTLDDNSYRAPSFASGATAAQITLSTLSNGVASNYSPTNYTAVDNSVHGALNGIDNALGSMANLNWVNVTGTSQLISVNSGYVTNNPVTVTYTLPATPAFGDSFKITCGASAQFLNPWVLAQNASQQIFFGVLSTTIGVTGSLTSRNKFDSVELLCVVAGASARWVVISSVGNIDVI